MFACNGILFNHESPRRGNISYNNKVIIDKYFKNFIKKLLF